MVYRLKVILTKMYFYICVAKVNSFSFLHFNEFVDSSRTILESSNILKNLEKFTI